MVHLLSSDYFLHEKTKNTDYYSYTYKVMFSHLLLFKTQCVIFLVGMTKSSPEIFSVMATFKTRNGLSKAADGFLLFN